jgi:hypothetical protein
MQTPSREEMDAGKNSINSLALSVSALIKTKLFSSLITTAIVLFDGNGK